MTEIPEAFQDWGFLSIQLQKPIEGRSTSHSCNKMLSKKPVNFTSETMQYLTCHSMISNYEKWTSVGDCLLSLYTKQGIF
jgi:hypothetical protein